MGGLERQVSDYHEREEDVQRLARDSKQKVEDALSLKEQVCVSVCPCARMSVCVFVCVWECLSVSVILYLCINLSVCLSI